MCGSHARGEARSDSDIDFCIVCCDPDALLEDRCWFDVFGLDARVTGPVVQSIRVLYGETEAEFGIAGQILMELPIDRETACVMNDGLRVLHDPEGHLVKAVSYAASMVQ